MPGRNALGNDAARGIAAKMYHLGAGIDLLAAVGDRNRVELSARIVTAQDAARVFPGDGRTGFDLGPGNPRTVALATSPLGNEVEDAAAPLGIARIPVLDRRILDLGIVERNQFDDRCVKLVLVASWSGAALQIAHIRAPVGDDEGALELAAVAFVDAEIGRQLHRTTHARRH